MKTMQNAAPDSGTVVQVRALRYDLVKLRLGQALLPVALVAFPIARRFGSLPVVVAALIPGVAALLAFLSARRKTIVRLVAHPGRVKIGHSTIQAGEASRWRWHGTRATLFAPEGNVLLRAMSRADIQALRTALEQALGSPLTFRRRGSLRARVISLVVAAAGMALVAIGVAHHLVYLTPGVVPAIVGLATFAALSGRIADPASLSRRD